MAEGHTCSTRTELSEVPGLAIATYSESSQKCRVPRGTSRKSSVTRMAQAPGGTGSVRLNDAGGGNVHLPCADHEVDSMAGLALRL